jgi:hypothetical protein
MDIHNGVDMSLEMVDEKDRQTLTPRQQAREEECPNILASISNLVEGA